MGADACTLTVGQHGDQKGVRPPDAQTPKLREAGELRENLGVGVLSGELPGHIAGGIAAEPRDRKRIPGKRKVRFPEIAGSEIIWGRKRANELSLKIINTDIFPILKINEGGILLDIFRLSDGETPQRSTVGRNTDKRLSAFLLTEKGTVGKIRPDKQPHERGKPRRAGERVQKGALDHTIIRFTRLKPGKKDPVGRGFHIPKSVRGIPVAGGEKPPRAIPKNQDIRVKVTGANDGWIIASPNQLRPPKIR